MTTKRSWACSRAAMVAATAAALLAGSLSVTTARDAPDLLPGVDLVTEEVEPGVYRVLGDGTHDLRQNVWAVEATDDGDVWVLKYRVAYKEMATPGRIKPRFRDARVLRLGESGVSLRAGQDNMTNYPGLGLRDGRPAAYFSNQGQRVWDGDRWLPPSAPWEGGIYCEGIVVPEVGCWTHNHGDPGIVRQSLGGSKRTISSEEIGFDAEAWFYGPWAPVADHGFYALAYTGTREDLLPSHLVAFDGADWSTVELPGTGMAYPYMMVVLSDGSVWIGGRADGGGQMGSHLLARWDGNEWRTFEFAELPSDRPGLHEAADGRVWIDAVTYVDGSTVRQLDFVSDLGQGAGLARTRLAQTTPRGRSWWNPVRRRSSDARSSRSAASVSARSTSSPPRPWRARSRFRGPDGDGTFRGFTSLYMDKGRGGLG